MNVMRKRRDAWTVLITMLLVCVTALMPTPKAMAADLGLRSTVQVATSAGGMVVSETRDASQIGAAILEQGGNAVDATVAVAFALAVTWPEAGNIAGGGFMMIAQPNQDQVQFIDYCEKAKVKVVPN